MQFYVDTVKQMALRQLVAGTPLRTLCLLIAGQPADVFSTETTADTGINSAGNLSQQPAQVFVFFIYLVIWVWALLLCHYCFRTVLGSS